MDRVEFFRELGFGEYESKAVSSLVRLGVASVKEISLNSGVPQNKLYGILRKFEMDMILAEVPGNVKKYRVINLKSFIGKRIVEKSEKLKDLRKCSEDLQRVKGGEEEFSFSLIRGQRAVMNKLAEMNLMVKSEVLGVHRNWRYWGEGIREMEKAVKKGVDVKMVGVINNETWKRAKEWKKIGCKIRKYNRMFGEFPLRFSVFDRKWARITIGKPEIKERKDYITIWTDSKPLVKMLREQFLRMWGGCEEVGDCEGGIGA